MTHQSSNRHYIRGAHSSSTDGEGESAPDARLASTGSAVVGASVSRNKITCFSPSSAPTKQMFNRSVAMIKVAHILFSARFISKNALRLKVTFECRFLNVGKLAGYFQRH